MRSFDRARILAFVASYAGQPGADPSLTLDPWYWVGRIVQTGGLGDDNAGYWIDRFFGRGVPETPDPFALDPGPLDPIDEGMDLLPVTVDAFVPLVSDHLAALAGADDRLAGAGDAVVAADLSGALATSSDGLLEPAVAAHAGVVTAFDAEDPSDVVAATQNHGAAIDAGEGQYGDPLPPDLAEPDPGPQPVGGDDTPKPPPPDF